MTHSPNYPRPGEYYYHYKSKLNGELASKPYLVLAVEPSRTDGVLTVVYMALYADDEGKFGRIHTRHVSEWTEPVLKPEYTGDRFLRISPGRNAITSAVKALASLV